MDILFKFETIENILKITNLSNFTLVISEKPIDRRYKIRNVLLIRPREFMILDADLDLTKIYISLEVLK